MSWIEFRAERLSKEQRRRLLRPARFYADHNMNDVIVRVLRHLRFDVECAKDIGAQDQPDQFHYRRAFTTRRVLLTCDKDFVNGAKFPLSQTWGVIVLNVDPGCELHVARALVVLEDFLAGVGPVLKQRKIILNSDYTASWIFRAAEEGTLAECRVRCRFDRERQTVWLWSE